MNRKRIVLAFLILLCSSICIGNVAVAKEKNVVIIPVYNEVEKGLAAFIERGIEIAENEGADHIILEIDTFGGAVEAATDIAKLMRQTEIPITAFINKKAISAGAYIALNADNIVMVPGATIGAAGIIDGAGNAADKKAQSFWIKEMVGAANLNERDPLYAEAMANDQVDMPEYGAPVGEYLTLTANQALEVGYAENVLETRQELLTFLDLESAAITEIELALAEKVARFITHPIVVPILLSIGSLGLVLELYSPGFGIPGIMGLTALALFFYGHLVAGLAGLEAIVLLVLGIMLIFLEIFVPGGILGALGFGAIVGSLLMSTNNIGLMLLSILIAFVVTLSVSIILYKIFGFRIGIFKRLILTDSTSTEEGYVSYDDRSDLAGKEGLAITPLRPSGTGLFEGKRIDVVTEGSYIENGKKIKIIEVSGGRVIVREIE